MIPEEDLKELREIHAHLPFAHPMEQVPVATIAMAPIGTPYPPTAESIKDWKVVATIWERGNGDGFTFV